MWFAVGLIEDVVVFVYQDDYLLLVMGLQHRHQIAQGIHQDTFAGIQVQHRIESFLSEIRYIIRFEQSQMIAEKVGHPDTELFEEHVIAVCRYPLQIQ